MDTAIGILAGGKSSRMGSDKAKLKWQNDTMLGTLVKRFNGYEVIVSTANAESYENIEATIVTDELKGIGPTEGIYQILKKAHSKYTVVFATDMPFVTETAVKELTKKIETDTQVLMTRVCERDEPLFAVYSKDVLPALEIMRRERVRRISDIRNYAKVEYIDIEQMNIDVEVLRNLNTREEYEEAKRQFEI